MKAVTGPAKGGLGSARGQRRGWRWPSGGTGLPSTCQWQPSGLSRLTGAGPCLDAEPQSCWLQSLAGLSLGAKNQKGVFATATRLPERDHWGTLLGATKMQSRGGLQGRGSALHMFMFIAGNTPRQLSGKGSIRVSKNSDCIVNAKGQFIFK